MKEGLSRSGSLKRRSKINEKRLFENSAAGDIHNTAEALTDACVAFASDSMNPAAMNSFNEELYNQQHRQRLQGRHRHRLAGVAHGSLDMPGRQLIVVWSRVRLLGADCASFHTTFLWSRGLPCLRSFP